MEGFIVIDSYRALEAIGQLTKWIAAGDIKHRETLVDAARAVPRDLSSFIPPENGQACLKP